MFHKEFYPTPSNVIERMCACIDLYEKVVYEPHGGKADIIKYVKNLGAKVIFSEINKDLASICSKYASIVDYDFFNVTSEQISHVDFIIMNPPFSNADKHIKHAFEIAPEGCHIISLANYETVNNRHTKTRIELQQLINQFGNYENLGKIFSEAERETDVNTVLINLYKPRVNPQTEFDGYFDLEEESYTDETGVLPYNELQGIVNSYVSSVKLFDSVIDKSKEIQSYISPINYGGKIIFGAFMSGNKYGELHEISRETFKSELQKAAWKTIFKALNFEHHLTKKVREDINQFVERQKNVPFTVRNIYKMIELIYGTRASRYERIITEAFEDICSFSSENSTAGEKWKTNSHYKINKRFIMNRISRISYAGELTAESDKIDDIIKALCFLTGNSYENHLGLSEYFCSSYRISIDGKFLCGYKFGGSKPDDYSMVRELKCLLEQGENAKIEKVNREFGKWISWNEFFNVRGYKKGTMHFEFKDSKVLELFNKEYARIKGWQVPHKTDQEKNKSKDNKTESNIVSSPKVNTDLMKRSNQCLTYELI